MKYVKMTNSREIKVYDNDDNFIGSWVEFNDDEWYWNFSQYAPSRFYSPENMKEIVNIIEEVRDCAKSD
jgi:hypothetical protein